MTLDRPHPQALYRMFDAERRLLYIGITSSWPHRLSQHERDKAWWRDVSHIAVEWHPNRRAVEEAERAAIFAERPIHNIAGASELPTQRIVVSLDGDPEFEAWYKAFRIETDALWAADVAAGRVKEFGAGADAITE